jgi:hypothetical protein
MTTPMHSLWQRVEAFVTARPGLMTAQIAAEFPDVTRKRIVVALNNLQRDGRIHGQAVNLRFSAYFPGPRPVATRATPIERHSPKGNWTPPRWTNEISRPGGEANRLCGSLQPDGTVKPYHAPIHGCVGSLRQSANQGRD